MFLMASISFWTVRAEGLVMAYYNLFSIARLPDTAFRGGFKAVFTVVIPMLVVANVPVKVLAGTLNAPAELILMFGLSGATALSSKLIWTCAMRRYTSASS